MSAPSMLMNAELAAELAPRQVKPASMCTDSFLVIAATAAANWNFNCSAEMQYEGYKGKQNLNTA